MIKAEVLKVDAEMVMGWLARTEELGFHNRRLSNRVIEQYTHAMLTDHWELNGEAVILDEAGALLNGQHRAHAVLEATVADEGPAFVEMLVAQGVKRNTFRTMDQGLRRSAGQILGMQGVSQGNNFAALVRHIRVWEVNRYINHNEARLMDNSEVSEIALRDHAILAPAVAYGKRAARDLGRPSLWSFVYWLLIDHAPDDALSDFLEPLLSGANLHEGHPVLALRRKMLKARTAHVEYHPKLVFSMAVRTWNALQRGRTLAQLQVPKLADPIPELKG